MKFPSALLPSQQCFLSPANNISNIYSPFFALGVYQNKSLLPPINQKLISGKLNACLTPQITSSRLCARDVTSAHFRVSLAEGARAPHCPLVDLTLCQCSHAWDANPALITILSLVTLFCPRKSTSSYSFHVFSFPTFKHLFISPVSPFPLVSLKSKYFLFCSFSLFLKKAPHSTSFSFYLHKAEPIHMPSRGREVH